MEWPGFLSDHVDPGLRDRLPNIAAVMVANGVDPSHWQHSEDERAQLIGLGDDLVRRGRSGTRRSVPSSRRSGVGPRLARLRAPGRLLVVLRAVVRDRRRRPPIWRLRRAPRTTGRWPASVEEDDRLHGVAMCDLDEPERSVVELDAALDMGLGLVWIPAHTPGGRAPGHPDHDAFWARLAERGVPSCSTSAADACRSGVSGWTTGGRPRSGSAGPRSSARRTSWSCTTARLASYSVLVLDGVLERHRGCAAALSRWVPDGCPTCFAGSITPPRSGAAPGRGSRRSSEPHGRAASARLASPPIRSKTSAA